MRYTRGDVFNSLDTPDEIDWEVTEAIVTDERIAIDWIEDDEEWVLIAHSSDGTEYKGSYGIDRLTCPPLSVPPGRIQFTDQERTRHGEKDVRTGADHPDAA